MSDVVPVVAARNDTRSGVDVYARSKAHEIQGRDPGFEYEYFSTDPTHPSFVGERLKKHEIGNPVAGFCMVDPWEVVKSTDVVQGAKRPDDTKGLDSTITHGKMVLCRTPKANRAKYDEINRRKAEAVAMATARQQKSYGGVVRNTVSVHTGFAEDGAGGASFDDVRAGRI